MKIEILGSGCPKCKKLYEHTITALKNLNKDAEVTKVDDIEKIISYGVLSTPALVIDGGVKTTGSLPSVAEIEKYIKELS